MGGDVFGIVELNGLFLLAGLGIVWAVRGWCDVLDLVESLGLAYMLGLCAVCTLSTIVLVAGGDVDPTTTATCALGLFVATGAFARLRRRALCRSLGRPSLSLGTLLALAAAAASVVVVVALFREASIMPLGGGDSWEFWVPKAKTIYFDH